MERIKTLFNVSYGQKEYHNKEKLKKGSTLLISSKGTDNGCYGFFDIVAKYTTPIITLPSTGTVGEAFVQVNPCCVDDNCLVLEPKQDIAIEKLFQICLILRKEKWRFMYGRQITPERIANFVITDTKIRVKYAPIKKSLMPINNNKTKVKETNYDRYKIGMFFKPLKGGGKYFEQVKLGKTPLVSTQTDNNGIIGYVDLKPLFKSPAITVSRITGKAYVQPYDFATVPDDIYVLKPIEDYDIKVLIYFANIISYEGWRFNYSRKATPERLENLEIYLPIDSDKNINFKHMEEVIDASYGSDKLTI